MRVMLGAGWAAIALLPLLAGCGNGEGPVDPIPPPEPSVETPAIATVTLSDGETGLPYTASLEATGGSPPYVWSLASGSLPDGVALDAAGGLSGVPSSPGMSEFSVQVTDDNAQSDSSELRIAVAVGYTYSLDLSTVATREHMQDWDPAWISEVEEDFDFYEFQVDPGNGGQVGIWAGSGNPTVQPDEWRDFSQFIAAGPPAGMPVRVRMKFEHQDDGTWVSCSHATDVSTNRGHYEVALQSNFLQVFKYWGDGFASIAGVPVAVAEGAIYWIHLVETRAGNAIDGHVTIDGELFDENLNSLATISATDDGTAAFVALRPSSNKRGFGSFCASDGTGAKILEWHVEPAP